jgi:sugar lactone lactonase YvrE
MLRCLGRTTLVRDVVRLIAATSGAALAAAACSSSGSTAPRTGSLTVTIVAPAGVAPSVTVNGPGGYTKALSATATLSGLAVGSYTVTAAPVTTADSVVGSVDTGAVTGSPAAVTANATATAAATYARRPGSGGLWVANFRSSTGTVLQYQAGQLASTTSAPPAIAIADGGSNAGVAFDASGNLWLTAFPSDAVVEYSASQLSSSKAAAGTVVLGSTVGSLSHPAGLAFDASGNLWVANDSNNTIVEFTTNQITSSGSPTPAVTIGGSALQAPWGLAFDASGHLWVANALGNTLVEFTPGQLGASGSPTPAVTLSATANSLVGPLFIAFDPSGNLWVANDNTFQNTVVEFSAGQLTATGSPTPAVTLSGGSGSLAIPIGLAFDASGNLWTANFAGSVVEFTPGQLATSGSPTPHVIVTGSSLDLPFGLAFDPHATNLPLKP